MDSKVIFEYISSIMKKDIFHHKEEKIPAYEPKETSNQIQFPTFKILSKNKTLGYEITDYYKELFIKNDRLKVLNAEFISDREELFQKIKNKEYTILMFPYKLEGEDSLELLKTVREISLELKIFLLLNTEITRQEMLLYLRNKLNNFIIDPVGMDVIIDTACSV